MNGRELLQLIEPGEEVFDPETGQYVDGPPTVIESYYGTFYVVGADTRYSASSAGEDVEAFALVPLSSSARPSVESNYRLRVVRPDVGSFTISGVEWQRVCKRLRLVQ